MKINEYGAIFLTAEELFDSIYLGKVKNFQNLYIDDANTIQFNNSKDTNRDHINSIQVYKTPNISVEQFDTNLQNDWFFTEQYRLFDIGQWLLDQCKTEKEIARVLEELKLYVQHDMVEVLNYLKYLVDTMRANNIVWGVGRGSSVASYCLYLIGIHKIDSIRYELDIKEFLK